MNVLSCNQITYSYPNTTIDTIRNLSINIKSGMIIGLVGMNGCGKTTLLRLITGILQPDIGVVIYNNKLISGTKFTRKIANIVFENSKLFLVGPSVIDDLSKIVGNKDYAKKLLIKNNLGHLLNKKIYHLSEGQRKIIAIFNSLHQDKEIFILDEPTIGLDQEGRNLIFSLMTELKKKDKIILIATNDMRLIPKFDRLIILKDGLINYEGSPQEVLFELEEKTSIIPNQTTRIVKRLKNNNIQIPAIIKYEELNSYLNKGE